MGGGTGTGDSAEAELIEKSIRDAIEEESIAKPSRYTPPERFVLERFTVNSVIASSYEKSFTPNSEIVIGSSSPRYKPELESRLILNVTPKNPQIPVKVLYFNGISPVRGKDDISAKIARCEVIPKFSSPLGYFHGLCETNYFDRGLITEEHAIELNILSEYGATLRTDMAVNYAEIVGE